MSDIISKLDLIHQEALSKIKLIINSNENYDIEDEYTSIEIENQKLTNDAYSTISEYRNLLTFLKSTQPNERYDIYNDRLSNLKIKLRESQLINVKLTNDLIQNQSILKYQQRQDTQKDETRTLAQQREELFKGRASKNNEASTLSKQNQILDKNKSITASLQATRQMMSTSIMHTELNIDTVDQQTKDLDQLNNKFTDFNDLLNRSKAIIKFIQKQDRNDKNKIYMSLGFLAFACAWVIWRRLLKTPVYLLLWSFFKIFRILNWFLGSTLKADIVTDDIAKDGVSTYIAVTTTAIAAIVSGTSNGKDSKIEHDIVVDIDEDSIVQTWEDVVDQDTMKIDDEL